MSTDSGSKPQFRLSRQYLVMSILLAAVWPSSGVGVVWDVAGLEGRATQLNVAASLRWLARDIDGEANRWSSGGDVDVNSVREKASRLRDRIALLSTGGVFEGSNVPGMPVALRPLLRLVDSQRDHLERSVAAYLSGGGPASNAPERLEVIHSDARALFDAADALTRGLAKESDAAHASIVSTLRYAALAMGGILILSLVVLRVRVVAPLLRMNDAARRFARGERTVRVACDAADEIGDLARAFDLMAEELGGRIVELERAHADLEKLSLAIEHSPASVMITDAAGRIEYVNPRFTEVSGYSAGEAVGRSPSFLKAGTTADTVYAGLWRTLVDGRPWRGRLLNRRKSGDVFWEDTWISPIRDASGKVAFFVAVKEDITDKVRREDEQIRLQEELERLVVKRTQQLTTTVKELEAFSYTVSHDLKAPVRAINGYAQLMEESCSDCDNEESLELLGRIQAASRRMGAIIDDLHRLTRVARTALTFETVDISGIARIVLDGMRATAPARSVEATIQPGIECHGDAGLLRLVMENLVGNAWKFTSGRPVAHIDVSATHEDGETAITVSDDGAGFDMAYADKLFQPFQRLHGVREFEGSGIGLATVARIIQLHGGRVMAYGAPGHGARITFTIPDVVADDRSAAAPLTRHE